MAYRHRRNDAAGREQRECGNAADPRAQVITAAGQGSAAAIAINNDLVTEDLDRALEAGESVPSADAGSDATAGGRASA